MKIKLSQRQFNKLLDFEPIVIKRGEDFANKNEVIQAAYQDKDTKAKRELTLHVWGKTAQTKLCGLSMEDISYTLIWKGEQKLL